MCVRKKQINEMINEIILYNEKKQRFIQGVQSTKMTDCGQFAGCIQLYCQGQMLERVSLYVLQHLGSVSLVVLALFQQHTVQSEPH